MKIGVLGSGAVGQALATGLINEGHEVWLATREPDGDKAGELKSAVTGATVCDFAVAAREAEMAVFCVKWSGAEEIVDLIGPENLAGKVVIDTSNIIKPEADTMVYGFDGTSAAEKLQQWLPDAKVVKAFNTVGADQMYQPDFELKPTMFVAGDDAEAKNQVSAIITLFGWDPLDAGGLIASRELEAMALVWIRNSMANGRHHAFKLL